MKSILALLLLPVLSTTASLPAKSLSRRADFCDQWGTSTTSNYIVYNNLWGQESASSGQQCTGVDSASGGTIAWHTTWSWAGAASSVKSFANAALKFNPTTLADVGSIPGRWEWSYQGTDLVANVACDLFLSSTANGDSEYEIMIWLAALGGAGPISETGSPIASVDIAGVSWQLYSGMNGAMQVYSFVAESRTESFQGDLREFFGYLESNQGLGTGLYLTDVQAGTEPFTGQDARFDVSAYEVRVE